MLRELKRMIDEAIRQALVEALGTGRGSRERTRAPDRPGREPRRPRSIATPEEQAALAAMRRISFN